jgi:hypothetical protein
MSNYDKAAIFGNYKEYILIERESLHELKDKAKELFNQSDNDTGALREANAIMNCVKFIKERNIYNREFKLKP